MRRASMVGIVARVRMPVHKALLAIVEQQRVNELPGERRDRARNQKIIGEILERYVMESFGEVFTGITWEEFIARQRKRQRVQLRLYALTGTERSCHQ